MKYSIEELIDLREAIYISLDNESAKKLMELPVKPTSKKSKSLKRGKSFNQEIQFQHQSLSQSAFKPFKPLTHLHNYSTNLPACQFQSKFDENLPINQLRGINQFYNGFQVISKDNNHQFLSLPPGTKVFKLKPGMEFPPGCIRIPSSMVSDRFPVACPGYPIANQFNRQHIAKHFPDIPVPDPTQAELELPANESDDQSPYSTLDSSDSFNIQIQLPSNNI